jgi:hypothetical protein
MMRLCLAWISRRSSRIFFVLRREIDCEWNSEMLNRLEVNYIRHRKTVYMCDYLTTSL